MATGARSGRADDVLRSDLLSSRRHPGESRPSEHGGFARVARAIARLPSRRICVDASAADEGAGRPGETRPAPGPRSVCAEGAYRTSEDGIWNSARIAASGTPSRLVGIASRPVGDARTRVSRHGDGSGALEGSPRRQRPVEVPLVGSTDVSGVAAG